MANFNLNKVILGGKLTADPELKQTQNGVPVATFSIAVNRKFKDSDGQYKADFFNVTAWRQQAEFVSKFFKKGASICIVGSLQNRSWEKDGQKHYMTDVVAGEISFVDSAKSNNGGTNTSTGDIPAFDNTTAQTPKFETVDVKSDTLPF